MTFLNHTLLFAEPSPPSPSAIGMLIPLVLAGFVVAGFWKTFEKAGKPGWGAIIPIYNLILLLEIAGKPNWWIILFFIPVVNVVVAIIMHNEVAGKFGKGAGFGLGLALLPPIFYPILGFGSAQYRAGYGEFLQS